MINKTMIKAGKLTKIADFKGVLSILTVIAPMKIQKTRNKIPMVLSGGRVY